MGQEMFIFFGISDFTLLGEFDFIYLSYIH